jgi:hypothetical protein
LLQFFAAEKQTAWKFILSLSHRLLQRVEAMPQNVPRGAQPEEINAGW